jgi:hypothetical protein
MTDEPDHLPPAAPDLLPSPAAPRCRTCGSDEVLRDAWARWDQVIGDWVVTALFDHAWCEACDAETKITYPGDSTDPLSEAGW